MSQRIYGTEDERVRELHYNSFVFDYAPYGEPIIAVSADEKELVESLIEQGVPLGTLMGRIKDHRLRKVAQDAAFDEELSNIWKISGVNCATVTLGLGAFGTTMSIREAVYQDAARWQRQFEVSSYLVHCKTVGDVENAFEEGKIGIILNIQDGSFMEKDLESVEILYNLGFRIVQLTYNRRNLIGDGCTERKGAGLSYHGIEVVKKMNELGIIVDLSHCCHATTMDGIAASQKPVAVTHAFCSAVNNHDRGKADEALKALADNDGYLGILTLPIFLSNDGSDSFAAFLNHVEYACTILGPERIGIGTDWVGGAEDMPLSLQELNVKTFMGLGFRPEHGLRPSITIGRMKSYLDWSFITEALLNRGYSEAEVKGFTGLNFLRFMQRSIG